MYSVWTGKRVAKASSPGVENLTSSAAALNNPPCVLDTAMPYCLHNWMQVRAGEGVEPLPAPLFNCPQVGQEQRPVGATSCHLS